MSKRRITYNERAKYYAWQMSREIAYCNFYREKAGDEPITLGSDTYMNWLLKYKPLLAYRIAKRYKPYKGEKWWI